MHRHAVVADNDLTELPFVPIAEPTLRRVRPEFVEQRFALLQSHARDVAVGTVGEEDRLVAGRHRLVLGLPRIRHFGEIIFVRPSG